MHGPIPPGAGRCEGEAAKLSPQARELWEALELTLETSAPEEATPGTLPPQDPEEEKIVYQMAELPEREQGILERLMELMAGLYEANHAESLGQPGEPQRNEAVILAAGLKDRREGRKIAPDIAPAQAVARIREPA